jgi:ABC-type uncharacterized transport system ATPase subunit
MAVHRNLEEELKKRKEYMENITGRKTKGGLTNYSEMAAMELNTIRKEGDKIIRDILKIKEVPIKKVVEMGIEREYVSYELFKKLHIYVSILSKKRDSSQFHVEVAKLKGQQKNEIKYIY